ncbi:hypothetical protein PFICI_02114 [Pestalotiopsis fici W106-1]|uniref:Uncharacterized protein n=1 Tax=Pestalotiopsis fici (strain W106-1 / CGMCC3.15140) TaxID=1229662 RepID=W3XDJ0_PESFW|nr:uncharacterized protein PFICI_02114 [Pestalotiopsis fici W106-1]ETS84089.1 hypothetical protein PFICI_02114 [Pestalotiopsis fici W106-1]
MGDSSNHMEWLRERFFQQLHLYPSNDGRYSRFKSICADLSIYERNLLLEEWGARLSDQQNQSDSDHSRWAHVNDLGWYQIFDDEGDEDFSRFKRDEEEEEEEEDFSHPEADSDMPEVDTENGANLTSVSEPIVPGDTAQDESKTLTEAGAGNNSEHQRQSPGLPVELTRPTRSDSQRAKGSS